MKNLNTVVSTLALVALTAISASADTVLYRAGMSRGQAPTHDVFVFTDKLDIVAMGVRGASPIYEVGHLWPVSKSKRHIVLAGVYGSRWEKADKWYAEPFMLAKAWHGKTTAKAKLFAYLPLNGGATYVGADELSVVHKVSSRVEVGVEGSFFKANPSPLEVQWGPTIRFEKGDTSVSARYLSFGKGASTFRLSISRSFP